MISLSALMFVRSTHSFCLVFDELMKEGAPAPLGLTSQTPSDQSRSFSLSQNHTHTHTHTHAESKVRSSTHMLTLLVVV